MTDFDANSGPAGDDAYWEMLAAEGDSVDRPATGMSSAPVDSPEQPRLTRQPVVVGPEAILEQLSSTFGYQTFRPGQQDVIDAALGARDCLAVMPTGSGKSLTYQLSARLTGGTTLVVSPLIALMKDQVDAAHENCIRATLIN